MLKITIPDIELYNDETNEFTNIKGCDLQLEHSLISLSKWESKWHKPFINNKNDNDKTDEEIRDYVRCMTLTQNVDPLIYQFMPARCIKEITEYIENPMTATWFSNEGPVDKRTSEIITSEIIYYWMIALQIPVEFQKWHLNKLLTLIRVVKAKNTPPKKRSANETMKMYADLNEQRRKMAHSKG